MNPLKVTNPGLRPLLAIFLPLALWAILWLSLASGPGNIQGIINPGSPVGFLHALRTIFPIAVAAWAIYIILAGVSRQGPRRHLLLGPLGLAAVYGLVGLASSLLSPDRLEALYWAGAYLSVPLILWAIVRGANTTRHLRRLINFNWLLAMALLGAAALLSMGRGALDLGSLVSNPSALLECQLSDRWFEATGGVLRQTGAGRYAAVVGLIALAGLWRGSWRPVWSLVLVGSLALLLASGARTAFVGFAAAAVFVVLLYEGKRAVVAGVAVLIVLVPLAWATGVHQSFLNSCILRRWEAPAQLEVPPGNWALVQALPQQLGRTAAPAQMPLPEGKWALQKSSSRNTSGSEAAHGVSIDPGEWKLQPSPSLPEAPSAPAQPPAPAAPAAPAQPPAPAAPSAPELPRQLHVPPGEWVLARASPADSPAAGGIPAEFFTFTGRTAVWAKGWELFARSPLLGFGFHADRLILRQHMHNSFMHALIQTGLIGAIPFVAAILLGWILLLKALRNLARLPVFDKHLVIQTGGILAFLTIRSITESTGAFFGVDWLLLAPLLLYLQVVSPPGDVEVTSP